MNSQTNTDVRIDHILTALRTTEPPAGLEARIAARLAQARSQSAAAPSFFADLLKAVKTPSVSLAPQTVYLAATVAIILLVGLSTLTYIRNRPTTQSQTTPYRSTAPTRRSAPQQTFAATTTPKVSLSPHATRTSPTTPLPPSAQDPDQLALAETLAPSRPGPPLPLTTQEQTLVAATRPGQPIQLAELDLARAPQLRAAAEARRGEDLQRYVKALLAPFAVADALQPTRFSEPREISQAVPAPSPTSSNN